ncbi:GNAT family N-acetyltransferase [Enterococcus hermanniensis]|uniref:N-acetyltransferase domain-containing protein n=1 Tax=Enterococcus hermanniensis TaxID=249189 RepID=A0A1L8TQI6_9ENTE|nr:GNAT family N-acetyltransferase [Enterococcus hermanniensis]OJG46334.1 hypothetical protein RV04_GL001500 [Enterococcus hermanniensis]
MKIEQAELFSKEHTAALKLRKQLLGGKIDWDQERNLIVFVAIEQGEVVGTAAIQLYPFGIARIRQVAVSPEYQGKKIGDQLMSQCEDLAQEQGHYRIVLTARKTAQTFYQKRKYKPIFWDFKKHTIDFVWMTKVVSLESAPLFSQQ